MQILLLALLFCAAANCQAASVDDQDDNVIKPYAKCNVQLKDFTYKEPLILQGLSIWKPDDSFLNFTRKMTLVCPGGTNVLSDTKEQIVQASCVGNELRFSGKSYSPSDVSCKTSVTGDVKTTKQDCADGKGTWSIIGFDLRNGTFIESYKVCYSQDTGDAIYSHHRLSGKSVQYKRIESIRPAFKSAGSAPGVSPAVAYKQNEQLETFNRLFGKRHAKKYLNLDNQQALARGHLSPDADFPLIPLQFATYFYVNVCPQWQVVNAGNWLRVETMVRQLASSRQDDFEIYTGVHDILTLPDKNNNPTEIYLTKDNKIVVPKYLWKIMYNKRRQDGIAFITVNNPYEEKAPKLLCENVCEENDWTYEGFDNLEKGFTYCCEVDDLRNKVPTVPALKVKKVLKFVNK